MSVGLVLVSHSLKLAEGLAEIVCEFFPEDGVPVSCAGGAPSTGLGATPGGIRSAVEEARSLGAGDVLILCDLGSSHSAARILLDAEPDPEARITSAPLIEGAVAAALRAAVGGGIEDCAREAEGLETPRKPEHINEENHG